MEHKIPWMRLYNIKIISLLIILLFCFCSPTQKTSDQLKNKEKYNVIFLLIDCLRADHVCAYGYRKPTTLNIDKFAKKSIMFEQAISQGTWTLPSHSSIFTSKYVSTHKVDNINKRLGDWELTLAEILRIYGYDTAAIVSGHLLDRQFNLDQGFNYYFQVQSEKAEKITPELLKLAQEWIKTREKTKFFLFLHNNDAHAPLHFPEPYEHKFDSTYHGIVDNLNLTHKLVFDPYCCYPEIRLLINKDNFLRDSDPVEMMITPRDIEHLIAHYDGGISYVDKFIGDIINYLKKYNLLKKTILIITADHGEGLLTHKNKKRFIDIENIKNVDFFWHDGVYYDEVLHVPLIIYFPDYKNSLKIKTQVELIDILPTLLDFLGIPEKIDAQGSSLLPLIEGKDVTGFKKYAFSEEAGKFISVRTETWKLINFQNDFELYHLETDPFELKDVSAEFPLKLKELSEILTQFNSQCLSGGKLNFQFTDNN